MLGRVTLTDSDPISALDRGDHAGAITLSLAGCGLTALPDSLRALSGSLRVLDLAGNRLTALPHWLSEFTELRVLFGSAKWDEAEFDEPQEFRWNHTQHSGCDADTGSSF